MTDSLIKKLSEFLFKAESKIDGLMYKFNPHKIPDDPLLLGEEAPTYWIITYKDKTYKVALRDNDIEYADEDVFEIIREDPESTVYDYLRYTCDDTIDFLSKELGLSEEGKDNG